MPKLAFVTSPALGSLYGEFVETLRYELAEQDIPSTMTADFPAASVDLVYVLVDPDQFLAGAGPDSLPPEDSLRRTIFLAAPRPPAPYRPNPSEPDSAEPHGMAPPYLEHYQKAGVVFGIDQGTVAALRSAGVAARHLRPGYSPRRDCFDPAADRPIDVTFLGRDSPHRTWQLNRCAHVLAGRDCHIHLVGPGVLPAETKWEVLARTRIVLNIHPGAGPGYPQLEWLYVLEAIHGGAAVVTEHSCDIAPLVSGEHLLTSSPESFRYVLEVALEDENLCRRLSDAAYERIRHWLPFSLSAATFRAAAVELVGRPAATQPQA